MTKQADKLADALGYVLNEYSKIILHDTKDGEVFEKRFPSAEQALAEYEASKAELPEDRQKALAWINNFEFELEHLANHQETIRQALQQPAPDNMVDKSDVFAYLYEGEALRENDDVTARDRHPAGSIGHCLSAYGWVRKDLQIALCKSDPSGYGSSRDKNGHPNK